MSERDPPPDPPRRQTSRGGGLNVVRVQEAAAATGEHRAPLPPPARLTSTPPQAPMAPMPMAMDDLLSSSPPPTTRPITDPGRPAPRRPLAATMDLDPVVEGSLPVRRPALETSSPSLPRPRPPSPGALTSSPSLPAARQTSSPGPPPPARSVSAADLAFPSLAADAAPAAAPSGPSLSSTIAANVSSSLSGLRVLPLAAAGVVVIALVVGGVVVRTLADAAAGFSQAEARQLVDVWLKQGAWGRPRLDEVVAAVAAVGKTVTPAAQTTDTPPRFVVLREAERAQAIALADGTVVVTTGTLRRLQSEAELAAVLAHALAHLALGDATRALDEHPGRSEARAVLQTNRPHPAATVVDQLLSSPASSGSSDAEAKAITLTLQTLKAAGWSEAAFSDVLARLAGTTWAAQHPVPSSVGPTLQQAPRGREQRPELSLEEKPALRLLAEANSGGVGGEPSPPNRYSRTILDRVTPMTGTTTTPATPATPATTTSTAGRP